MRKGRRDPERTRRLEFTGKWLKREVNRKTLEICTMCFCLRWKLSKFLASMASYATFTFLSCYVCLVTQSCPTLCDPMDCSPSGSSIPGDSPGKNTGVGCHLFLQEIFPTQGLNLHFLCLLHCKRILYLLSHWESIFV